MAPRPTQGEGVSSRACATATIPVDPKGSDTQKTGGERARCAAAGYPDNPVGEEGDAECNRREVAALVHYLSSEEASFTTGACFDISGGRATY